MTFVVKGTELGGYDGATEGVCCGKPIGDAYVCYDGYLAQGPMSIEPHADCAAIVGQRLITGGYANRRRR